MPDPALTVPLRTAAPRADTSQCSLRCVISPTTAAIEAGGCWAIHPGVPRVSWRGAPSARIVVRAASAIRTPAVAVLHIEPDQVAVGAPVVQATRR
jgi:hypothetical protein